MGLRRFGSGLLLACGAAIAILACGSRTGLLAAEEVTADATPDRMDGGRDATPQQDGLPPIDVRKDVQKPPPVGCVHVGETQIYLITAEFKLLAFYPPTLAFKLIGQINCPTQSYPFSMAVERSGTAYSVFTNGWLYRISTTNAACQATSFAPDQQGYSTFGMGYAGDQQTEALYASDSFKAKGLATIDTTTFQLSFVGPWVPQLPKRCEMSGTSNNQLFAYCLAADETSGILAQIDRTTGQVIASNPVKVGANSYGFAFAYWGGDFYMFNSPGGATAVTRYDPVLQTETVVASYPGTIVGAGVSTCAPN